LQKNTRNSEKTRQKILAAAGKELVEEGLRGFGVNAIAARAGFGKPLIYRYFGDSSAVLDALAIAKAAEVEKTLAALARPVNSPLPGVVYRQVVFARVLAGDAVLRALFRAHLSGALGGDAASALENLAPRSKTSGQAGAAEAFLLAGISYVLLLRDFQTTCAGTPIETANDMARFERAFVELCSSFPGS